MAFCAECGTQLSEGAKFCPECGTAVPLRQAQVADAGSGASGVGGVPGVGGAAQTADPGDRAPGVGGAAQAATFAANALADAAVFEAPDAVGEFVAGTWDGGGLSSAAAGSVAGVVVIQAAQTAQGDAQQAQTQTQNQSQIQQPSVQYSSSGGMAPEPQQKKPKLPLVLAAALALATVAFCALYIVPLFIPHPHDPHEDMALTSDMAQTSSSAPSAASSSTETTPSAASSASSESAEPAASSEPQASAGAEATPDASTDGGGSASPQSFSTNERPELSEFTWLTGDAAKGNVPTGAAQLTQFADIEGGWKGYAYDGDVEWLLNLRIDSVQEGVAVTFDWYYLRIGGVSGEVREDNTPDSLFNGSWSDGVLDATGSGRVTIAAFWEKDGHQYATGSFMWPSGETCTIALVRP